MLRLFKLPPYVDCHFQYQIKSQFKSNRMISEALLLARIRESSSPSDTLFHTLQLYDQLIQKLNIPRTHQIALNVYQQLIYQYGQKNDENVQNYASPKRRADIQDPELFSFSKPSKMSPQLSTRQPLLKFKSDELQKIGQRPWQNPLKEVSEFNEYGVQNSKRVEKLSYKEETSKHQILRIYLLAQSWSKFAMSLRQAIRQRKKILKNQSTKYFREYRLIVKAFGAMKSAVWLQREKWQMAGELRFRRQKQLEADCFCKWHDYATRGEEERLREEQIGEKKAILEKWMAFNRVIDSLQTNLQAKGQQQEIERIKEEQQEKYQTVLKSLGISRMQHRFLTKRELVQKEERAKKGVRVQEMRVFIKLLKCKTEVEQQRTNGKIKKCMVVRANRLYRNLNDEVQFQKVYWRQPRKIIFLAAIFEAIGFSLKRKGYNHEWIDDLPAVLQKSKHYHCYRLQKLKTYFRGLKQAAKEQRESYLFVKYQRGLNVLTKLALNYKESIRQTHLHSKSTRLQFLYATRRVREGLRAFGKNGQFASKSEHASQYACKLKVVDALRVLRAYKISKQFYRSKIDHFEAKRNASLMESIYLEWKLETHRQVHHRLLTEHFRANSNKRLLQNIMVVLKGNCLEEKLIKRKTHNLIKLRVYTEGQEFLGKLKANRCLQSNKQTESKEQKMQEWRKQTHFKRMMRNCLKRKLGQTVLSQISRESELRLKFKIFRALAKCQEFHCREKGKVRLIEGSRARRTKGKCMSAMVNGLLMSLTLKRAANIIGFAMKEAGFEGLLYRACD